jgi:sucrose-phosphate synthase
MDEKGLYIQMFSIHGLLRSKKMELGRDADTGGQIKYVVELAKALGAHDAVRQVDLFTRLIVDKTVSEDYARPIETIGPKSRIIRIQCGGRKYMRKELLWPHLDEYIDKSIRFIKQEQQIPDVLHGHYPDAGYVAAMMAEIFGLPMVYTGHSLGRSKLERLLNEGLKQKEIVKRYKIDRRIQMEEEILKRADVVVTSTHQEIDVQYAQYEHKDLPVYQVIPPGLDIVKFYPYYHDALPDTAKSEAHAYAKASILKELDRFLTHPDRPLILSLCRPDKRKNIAGLITAFGQDEQLQAMANLAVFAGIRKDISAMEENEREVLTEILLLMDKYDLYGQLAIPKKHDFEYEVPALYRIAAERGGVFVNSALTEPFGITLIETAACGLPMIAPNDGGPLDILRNCRNGQLVDTTRPEAIAAAAKKIIANRKLWEQYSQSGVTCIRKYYTWRSHADAYVKTVQKELRDAAAAPLQKAVPSDAIGRRLAGLDKFLITGIDTVIDEKENAALEDFLAQVKRHRAKMGFGINTHRSLDAATEALEIHGISPDILICSAGTEFYYGERRHYGKGWETHIAAQWKRDAIVRLLEKIAYVSYRAESFQGPFKISCEMSPGKDRLARIHDLLLRNRCRCSLIYDEDRYLDILPYRASKGKAIRYLGYQWDIPLAHFLVCGSSYSDADMLRGEPKAVVPRQSNAKLKTSLAGLRNVYFADAAYAAGILEAIAHYRFFDDDIAN